MIASRIHFLSRLETLALSEWLQQTTPIFKFNIVAVKLSHSQIQTNSSGSESSKQRDMARRKLENKRVEKSSLDILKTCLSGE